MLSFAFLSLSSLTCTFPCSPSSSFRSLYDESRFESLTLSHNNMVALKPILQAWLEAAEAQARKARIGNRGEANDSMNVLPATDKKRKRTSIAAPEKRSLEAYFAVQPRPSGEKIAAIAEKLDLKKNVVRVWFCNQRQKQKRMKYSAVNQGNNMG